MEADELEASFAIAVVAFGVQDLSAPSSIFAVFSTFTRMYLQVERHHIQATKVTQSEVAAVLIVGWDVTRSEAVIWSRLNPVVQIDCGQNQYTGMRATAVCEMNYLLSALEPRLHLRDQKSEGSLPLPDLGCIRRDVGWMQLCSPVRIPCCNMRVTWANISMASAFPRTWSWRYEHCWEFTSLGHISLSVAHSERPTTGSNDNTRNRADSCMIRA